MKTNPHDPIEWRNYISSMTTRDGQYIEGKHAGLTKREYFASLAMQGMLANSYDNGMLKPMSQANNKEIAEVAVLQADALIAELNKGDE